MESGGDMSRTKRRHPGQSFVMIPRGLLFGCPEWKALSPGAKQLYILIKARYNGRNNGEISLPYTTLKGNRGLSAPATISKAVAELETTGFIERRHLGGLFRRKNLYKLTGRFDDHIPGNA